MRAWRAKNLSRSHDINRKSRQKNYKKWAPQINKMRRSLYNQTGWSKEAYARVVQTMGHGWLAHRGQTDCVPAGDGQVLCGLYELSTDFPALGRDDDRQRGEGARIYRVPVWGHEGAAAANSGVAVGVVVCGEGMVHAACADYEAHLGPSDAGAGK